MQYSTSSYVRQHFPFCIKVVILWKKQGRIETLWPEWPKLFPDTNFLLSRKSKVTRLVCVQYYCQESIFWTQVWRGTLPQIHLIPGSVSHKEAGRPAEDGGLWDPVRVVWSEPGREGRVTQKRQKICNSQIVCYGAHQRPPMSPALLQGCLEDVCVPLPLHSMSVCWDCAQVQAEGHPQLSAKRCIWMSRSGPFTT